jgi:hypothetical protein
VDAVAAQLVAVANIDPYVQVSETITSAGSVQSVVCAEVADAFAVITTNTVDWQVAYLQTANITDAPTNTVAAVAFISETATILVAAVTNNIIAVAVVAETARAFDSITQRLLWELIDDSQSVSWQVINTDTNSGWVLINDNQTPGWTTIDTI